MIFSRPTPAEQGQIKGLAARLALFLLPLAALFGIREWQLGSLPISYSRQKDLFESRLSEIEVLVLGSSCVRYGLNPVFFSRPTFNLGHGAESLMVSSELGAKYVPLMPRLKLVVINVNYDSFHLFLSKTGHWWRLSMYRRLYGIPGDTEGLADALTLENVSWVALYTPERAFKFGSDPMTIAGDDDRELWETYDRNGWGGPIFFRSRLQFEPAKNPDLAPPEGPEILIKRRFGEFLAAAEAHGVKVAVLITPFFEEYRKGRVNSIHEIHLALEDVGRNHKFRVFDYSADARFGDIDFADAAHIAPEAVEKLSRIVDQEIIHGMLD